MFDFHEKRKIRTIMYSKVSILLLFLLAIFIGMSVRERFRVEREMANRLEERAQELEILSQRAATLESEVTHLQNVRGIEEELRGRFDVARSGEQVVVIIDESPSEEHSDVSLPDVAPNDSEQKTWWDMLKFW